MTLLEKKVNAIARALLSHNSLEQAAALEELEQLVEGDTPAGTVPEEVERTLIRLGVPQHIVGYRYLQDAIEMCVKDANSIYMITKNLYPRVASIHGTTASKVERAIRHAVDLSFERCDSEYYDEIFGSTISPSKGKATNGEFIARISSVVRKRIRGT